MLINIINTLSLFLLITILGISCRSLETFESSEVLSVYSLKLKKVDQMDVKVTGYLVDVPGNQIVFHDSKKLIDLNKGDIVSVELNETINVVTDKGVYLTSRDEFIKKYNRKTIILKGCYSILGSTNSVYEEIITSVFRVDSIILIKQ